MFTFLIEILLLFGTWSCGAWVSSPDPMGSSGELARASRQKCPVTLGVLQGTETTTWSPPARLGMWALPAMQDWADKARAEEIAKQIEAQLTLATFNLTPEPEEKIPTFKEYASIWLEIRSIRSRFLRSRSSERTIPT